ncbi:unnamed protein product [Cunninghamella blakesleeana]
MSDEEYEYPHDSYKVWKHTSKWRPFQLDILKIDFQPGKIEDIIGNVDINNAILNDDIDRILLPGINITAYEKINITKKQLPFYNRLRQIMRFPDEPPVDSVAYDLLTWTEFEDTNIHFRPQPKLAMKWKNYNISSNADFGVYSDRSADQIPVEYLMIVEDKRARASTYQNGECQLAGEMLLAAYNRFENIQNDQIVYGIILKGSLVRFYKVTFSESYLQELRKSKYPTTTIEPLTFPPQTERALSLNIYEQREKIIKILCILKQKMERLVSY